MNPATSDLPIVVAMTGASGSAYGKRTLEVLLKANREVHFVFSSAAAQVIHAELGQSVNPAKFHAETFLPAGTPTAKLHYWNQHDLMAGIASGSFRTAGMVIVPCSMGTLSSLATGVSGNLIHRAAEVHLKERRPLIVMPRETPLSLVMLRNMVSLAEAGATIMPAMPGFYHEPESVDDLIDFMVARVCDHLQVEHQLSKRWGKPT